MEQIENSIELGETKLAEVSVMREDEVYKMIMDRGEKIEASKAANYNEYKLLAQRTDIKRIMGEKTDETVTSMVGSIQTLLNDIKELRQNEFLDNSLLSDLKVN